MRNTTLQDIQRWILNNREADEDFDQWYQEHQKSIDSSIEILPKYIDSDNSLKITKTRIETIWTMSDNGVPKIWFSLDTELRELSWQALDLTTNCIAVIPVSGIDRVVHGMQIDDDEEILLGDQETNYNFGSYHCTTGPHSILNGRERFYLWGEEVDPDDYWAMVATPESLERYHVLHLLRKW